MVADSALPVWSIRPNWQNGITETLEWLSDVLRGSYGTEQVRALRLSPRRLFEMTFHPVDQERAFLDLWLHRMSSEEFMLPLFHDHGLLTAGINAGATVIPFDTTYREFQVGGLAMLLGADAFTFDKVTIEAIAADSITVSAGGVTRAWPAGSSIHPLRRATLEDQSAAEAITSKLGQGALRFELNQANDLSDEGAWDVVFGSYPVILEEPNRRENIKVTFDLETETIDNDVGLRQLEDDAGRAFTLQTHLMMLSGRPEQWAFRQMLYRLRGQQGAVWLPSFNDDLELSRDRLAADALLDIKKIGYGYTGGVIDGRQYLLINGSIAREITALGAAPSATEERLMLDSALGVALPTGTTASFMDTCRLATDSVQINHITDSDGVAESSLSFRSFRDERTAPDPIDYPIPAAAKGVDYCGGPAADEAGCIGVDAGYWGYVDFDTSQGPNVPVMRPTWNFSLLRGGVEQIGVLSADNYSDYNGGLETYPATLPYDYLYGWRTYFFTPATAAPRGEAGFAADPFAAGPPDTLRINIIQYLYSNYIFPGDSVFSGDHGTCFATVVIPQLGFAQTVQIYDVIGLWPQGPGNFAL